MKNLFITLGAFPDTLTQKNIELNVEERNGQSYFVYFIHQLILVQIENNAFKIRFTILAIQVYYLHFQGM